VVHSGRALELGDETVDALLDCLGDGVARCHGDRILFANAALAALLGMDAAAKLADEPLSSFLEGTPALPELASEGPVECRLRRADGRLTPALVRRFDGLPDEDSVWVVRDVSELRERDALLTELSHELRTPVTVIAGYARLLLSEDVGPLNAVQRRFLQQSARSAQRLVDLIGRLLEAAAHAPGGAELECSEAPLGPTLDAVAGLHAPLLEQKQLGLEIALDPGAECACFDALRVEQVLSNLLGNAIRHAPPGSTIRVTSSPGPRGFVEIAVRDDGPGVAAGDRERIFLPYVRGGDGRRAGGLGLGLAIARRLVEAHGGSLGVRPAPDGGSVFAFTLPAAAGDGAPGEGRTRG
jgi:signal transduction histidine kinase